MPVASSLAGVRLVAGQLFMEREAANAELGREIVRGKRSDIHCLGCDVEKMRKQASDFAVEHTNQLTTPRHFEAEQLFRREAERMLLVHRRDIVEPVKISDRLQIGLVLDQLLGATVKQADVRVDATDHLTVEFQYKAKYTVRRRILWAVIDGEIAKAGFRHGELALVTLAGSRRSSATTWLRRPRGLVTSNAPETWVVPKALQFDPALAMR